MNDWSRDQLIDSWSNEYEEGGSPGCIMSFEDIINPFQNDMFHGSHSNTSSKPKKHKRKKPTKQELLDEKIIDELGNTPEPVPQEEIQAYGDDWFLEWLNVEPAEQPIKEFNVSFHYTEYGTTTIEAKSKDEALKIIRRHLEYEGLDGLKYKCHDREYDSTTATELS